MTILIGIICKDAIVLASDSQTTSGGLKRTDAEKITAVKFSAKEILVAQAGNAGNSARAIEILREMAKDKEISDYRTPADLARLAMIQVRQELRQQYGNCTATELQDLIWKCELQAELMLAYYFENKPYIFKLDLSVGRADKENSWYAALGCGANLGSYLLTEYTKPQMTSSLASVIAGYVVEEVCKHDAYCSPPARVGVICNDLVETAKATGRTYEQIHPSALDTSVIFICSANSINSSARAIEKIMQSIKLQRNKKIERLIVKESQKGLREFSEFIKNPTFKSFKKIKQKIGTISHWGHFKKGQ